MLGGHISYMYSLFCRELHEQWYAQLGLYCVTKIYLDNAKHDMITIIEFCPFLVFT